MRYWQNNCFIKSTDGIRDAALLESAINAPFQSFGDKDVYPSIQQKAARLGFGDVLQNGGIESCLTQFCGSPVVVLHGRIFQVDIPLTKVFTVDFANGEMTLL